MSKYDQLDASRELEQNIFRDLKQALKKRGCEVTHHGTDTVHSPAGLHDIEVAGKGYIVSFEVTKSRGAAQDREFQSIRDHLKTIKANNPRKRCFCVFSAPQISTRTYDSIRDNNEQRVAEGLADMKVMPLAFNTLEEWLTRLDKSTADLYPFADFLKIFDQYRLFIDDVRVRKVLASAVFPNDLALAQDIEKTEVESDERTLEQLIKDLDNVENLMRQHGIATAQNAIDNLIFLVFLKLYEEKREQEGGVNRLRSIDAFNRYRDQLDEKTRTQKRAIHRLFLDIADNAEFSQSGMFTPSDRLVDSLRDDFIEGTFIPKFAKYNFLGTKVDALGAVYEVLAQRAGKDVKVGQFFTPENIVRFMVDLAELQPDDMLLDPACGTGRFLIHGMMRMLKTLETTKVRSKEAKRDRIRRFQCFGADIDLRIAKLAKMNMWIHGDGKSNIFGGSSYNGLLLYRQKHRTADGDTTGFDGSFDVVLTNPPLGDLNYQVLRVDESSADPSPIAADEKMLRFPILPMKNKTAERLKVLLTRQAQHAADLDRLETELAGLEALSGEVTQKKRGRKKTTAEAKTVSSGEQKRMKSLRKQIERKREVIRQNGDLVDEIQALIRRGEEVFDITGNAMKGGALFVAAIANYLKADAYPEEVPEWRGGRMIIILDEGILNTAEYAKTRDFIRRNFYVKAVISLTRDTFVPISGTATKTSIVFATRKSDPRAEQLEPIFMAHAANVGIDTRGKVCANDLPELLDDYLRFRNRVKTAYRGRLFDRAKFDVGKDNGRDT